LSDKLFGLYRQPRMIVHLVLRTIALVFIIWFKVLVGYYSALANVNPGIIFGISSLVIVFNGFLGFYFFKEVANRMINLGMTLIIAGIVWISLAKN
jgi:drug/metabolite transporter (DMT)-like permease